MYQPFKKVVLPGIVAGVILLILSLIGLHLTVWLFPDIAEQYFNPMFDVQNERELLYYTHPFVLGIALSWFWEQCKETLKGTILTRGIEFGLIYMIIALLPMMWILYSSLSLSLGIVSTWLGLGACQALIAGLVFEKMNP